LPHTSLPQCRHARDLSAYASCFKSGGVLLNKKVYALALAATVYIAGAGPGFAASAQAQRGQRGGAAAAPAGGPNYGSAAVEGRAQIKPDLHFVYGGGANTVILVTPEGLIVADTKNPSAEISAALMTHVKAISPLPVKYVLVTHHHPDHTGNNQTFVDQGASVIGLQKLADLMASDQRTREIPGRPTTTFAKDYILRFGGAEAHMHFFGSSHTDGDTIIYFPSKRFVMLSDTVPFGGNPGISGTNAVQVPGLLASVLRLDFDSALGGRGPVLTRAEVEAYKQKWDTFIGRAKEAVRAGATKETLMSQVKMDDLGWTFNANFFGQLFDAMQANPNGEPRQAN
jgi:cyclase